MQGRAGIARGLVALVLVMVLVGLGVNALVSRTVERARSAEGGESETDVERAEPPSPHEPDLGSGGEPTSPPPRPTPPPTASPTPLPASPSPLTDDPRLTPMAPGTEPLPPPRTPAGYDEAAPPLHRGSLPPMVIRDIVRDALPELRFCFEWQLGQHPELAGRVTMELTIAQDGSVQEPRVLEDALGDETVTRCFTHVMAGLHFPPPDGDGTVLVRYPFMLDGAPAAREPEGI